MALPLFHSRQLAARQNASDECDDLAGVSEGSMLHPKIEVGGEVHMAELWHLTATEAVDKLRRGEVTPLEMVDAAAARIEAVEQKINALPIRFLDEARTQAKAFGRRDSSQPGWLAGLPVAIKDYNDV